MCPQSLSDEKTDVNYKIDVFIFGTIEAFAHRAIPIAADKIARETGGVEVAHGVVRPK